jgi:hypothetical protein
MICSICDSGNFDATDGAGVTQPLPLRCERCGIIVCIRCAGRYFDHSGARMLCCPACGRGGVLEEAPSDPEA